MNSSKRGPVYGFKLQSLDMVRYYFILNSEKLTQINIYFTVGWYCDLDISLNLEGPFYEWFNIGPCRTFELACKWTGNYF